MSLWNIARKPRLLIVEDEKDAASMLAIFLRHKGADVDVVLRGDEAVEVCRKDQYDLILLDIMLPDMDGFEVFRRLRQNGNDTPVIFQTVRGEQAWKLTGLELGAVDYVAKPYDIVELTLRIRNALRYRWLQIGYKAERAAGQAEEGANGVRIESLADLRQFIEDWFDLEELRTLCFDLRVDYDSLRGEGKAAKVRELLATLKRQRRLKDLIRHPFIQGARGTDSAFIGRRPR